MAKSLAEELLDRYEESLIDYLRAIDVQRASPTRAIDIPPQVAQRYGRLRSEVLKHLNGENKRDNG